MRERLRQAWQPLREQMSKLSLRERVFLLACVIVVSGFAMYEFVITPFSEALHAQSAQMEALERSVGTLGVLLNRYQKLQEKRQAIEEQYREVEIKEGVRAHLESLVKSKAGIASGYVIKSVRDQPFGMNYGQETFLVKFETVNFPAAVDFLEEVVYGKRPLILTRLDLKKGRNGENVAVEVDVSSIKKLG